MGKNTITNDYISNLIAKSEVKVAKMGSKTTVVLLTMPNGFAIVQSSSCVDPANYNGAKGKIICMARIEDKIWELEGYRLQCAIADMPPPTPPEKLAKRRPKRKKPTTRKKKPTKKRNTK